MKKPGLADAVKAIVVDQGSPITRYEVSVLRRWFQLPSMRFKPNLPTKEMWDRAPIRNVLSNHAIPSMPLQLTREEQEPKEPARLNLFRSVLKKYALCLHYANAWQFEPGDVEDHLLALKAHMLLNPQLISHLDAEELTVLLLGQTDWRLLGQLDLFEAKKRFLQLLPRFEFEQLTDCFQALQQSINAAALPFAFTTDELMRVADHIAAFEPISPVEGTLVLQAVGQSLAEAKVDHQPLFERLLASLAQPGPLTDPHIPYFLFQAADLRLPLDEKALLDLCSRALGVRGLPELRRLLCALIIFKKVTFRDSPRFSLQYEYYLHHFLERYRLALQLPGVEVCARDGVIAAYCRHFLTHSAGSSALAACAAAIAARVARAGLPERGYQSFSRGHIAALRYIRGLGLRVETEAMTPLGAVDFHLPELGLHIEHSGAAHALHFRPQLWSGYYVLRCNLLKRELPAFFEVRNLEDLRELLARHAPHVSLRDEMRALGKAGRQRRAFDRAYTAQQQRPLNLEDQLQFPIEDYARELKAATPGL